MFSIPDEVLHIVFSYLRIPQVVCINRTNKQFYFVSKLDLIWKPYVLRRFQTCCFQEHKKLSSQSWYEYHHTLFLENAFIKPRVIWSNPIIDISNQNEENEGFYSVCMRVKKKLFQFGKAKPVRVSICFSGDTLIIHKEESKNNGETNAGKILYKFVVRNCEIYDATKYYGDRWSLVLVTINEKEVILSCGVDHTFFKNGDEIVKYLTNNLGAIVVGTYPYKKKKKKKKGKKGKKAPMKVVEASTWTFSSVEKWYKKMCGDDVILKRMKEIKKDITGECLVKIKSLKEFRKLTKPDSKNKDVKAVKFIDDEVLFKAYYHFVKYLPFLKSNYLNDGVMLVIKKLQNFYPVPITNEMIEELSNVTKLRHAFLNSTDYLFPPKKRWTKEDLDNPFISDTVHCRAQSLNIVRLRIKLVIFESFQLTDDFGMGEIRSNSCSIVAAKTKNINYLYTGVLVGTWLLEFGPSGIVIPKRTVSGRYHIVLDVDTLYVKRTGMFEIQNKLAEICVKYNTQFVYVEKRGKNVKPNEKNCQNFVDDVLTAMDILPNFDGGLNIFVNTMRKNGKSKMVFFPSDGFKNYFTTNKKVDFPYTTARDFDIDDLDSLTDNVSLHNKEMMSFPTHVKFDNFVHLISKNCFEINELFGSDWLLLKCFDRIFWYRHLFHEEEKGEFTPKEPSKEDLSNFPTGCPFKDPREVL